MFHCPLAVAYATQSRSIVPATISLKNQLHTWDSERTSALVSKEKEEDQSDGKAVEYYDLKT